MRAAILNALREARASYPVIDLLDRETFIRNLAFVHAVITATPTLLAVAIAESRGGSLAHYFESHLEEERDHAQWLAEDLAYAGVDVGSLPISSEAVAMAGSQYYLIYHVDPAALLGYMAVLECFPMLEHQVDLLEDAHGQKLCRTLRHHALHDPDHGEDVLAQIDGLNDRQFQIVMENAMRTSAFIGSAISKMGATACMG